MMTLQEALNQLEDCVYAQEGFEWAEADKEAYWTIQKAVRASSILKSQTPDRKVNIIGLKNFPKYHDGKRVTFKEAEEDYGFIEDITEDEFKAIMEWLEVKE